MLEYKGGDNNIDNDQNYYHIQHEAIDITIFLNDITGRKGKNSHRIIDEQTEKEIAQDYNLILRNDQYTDKEPDLKKESSIQEIIIKGKKDLSEKNLPSPEVQIRIS